MTDDRAAALAEMDDTAKVREFYAQKRPVTAFIGNLAGSATDPINYFPNCRRGSGRCQHGSIWQDRRPGPHQQP
jgi:hypothetical protein